MSVEFIGIIRGYGRFDFREFVFLGLELDVDFFRLVGWV